MQCTPAAALSTGIESFHVTGHLTQLDTFVLYSYKIFVIVQSQWLPHDMFAFLDPWVFVQTILLTPGLLRG